MKTIRNLLALAFALLISFTVFGCFRKKKPSPNLEDWLQTHFPNRFDIVDTQTEDVIRNLSFKVKKSVIAERADSLVQIQVRYDKRDADLGLDPQSIAPQIEIAKREVDDARALFAALQNAGCQKISASIRHGDAAIMVFENPTPEARKQVLEKVITALKQWPAAGNYGLWLAFMEPQFYHQEFGDIIPLKHWVRPDNWQRANMTVFLQAKQGYALNVRQLEKNYEFNIESDRQLQMLERARPIALQWAEAHLKRKLVASSQTEYGALKGNLGTTFTFSFTETTDENAPVLCRVEGDFLLDEDVFKHLRLARE